MRYMLMMNAPRGKGDWQVSSWSPDDLKAHVGFMMALNDDLRKAGEFVGAEGLSGPDEAKLVRMSKSGGPPVTDGVFPESKEFLAGFWIVDVDTPRRAYELAARISSAPGPGGAPLGLAIEVRPVMSAPPVEV